MSTYRNNRGIINIIEATIKETNLFNFLITMTLIS